VLPRLEASLASAAAKKIKVDWYVGDHGAIDADPDLFDELVDELVANSISWLEKSQEKRIVVTLRTALPDDLSPHLQRRATAREPYTWIRFEDSGPGVASELKEKIFELFYSTNPSGMGFGLSIVRKNLRDVGGDIVESGMPGQGARFDLFLPIARQK
jgi:signal transduction histidine kinase